MNAKEILPIGTVLYLKEGTEKLMILNRAVLIEQDDDTVLFDYSGAIYPVGLNPEQIFYFNQDNIDKVVFEGFKDEDEERFLELYKNWLKTDGAKIPKGSVKSMDINLNGSSELGFD